MALENFIPRTYFCVFYNFVDVHSFKIQYFNNLFSYANKPFSSNHVRIKSLTDLV